MRKLFFIFFFLLVTVIGKAKDEIAVLQWNIWQEGTIVAGGYDAIVNEIVRLQPDFVTFSEVRNYNNIDFSGRIRSSLKEEGLRYYSFFSCDTGLLSKHPIIDSLTVFPENGDYRLTSSVDGHKVAVYTTHLDYLNCAYYNVRGYDGSDWKEISIPVSVDEILRVNVASQRDDAIKLFIRQAEKDISEGYNIIIGGDFNEPSHKDWIDKTKEMYDHHGFVIPWTVTILLDEAGFIDTYRELYPNPLTHPGFTYPSDNPTKDPLKLTWAPKVDERDRIDYIFYKRKGLKAIKAVIFGPKSSIVYGKRVMENSEDQFLLPLDIWPTDHKGLLMTFKLK